MQLTNIHPYKAYIERPQQNDVQKAKVSVWKSTKALREVTNIVNMINEKTIMPYFGTVI